MVVDRIFLERSRHRVVRSKGRKPLPSRQRDAGSSKLVLRGRHQLVEISVRVTTIDVSLADNPRVQLPALQRCAFEIDAASQCQGVIPKTRLQHDERLRQIALGEVTPMNGRRFSRRNPNGLRTDLYVPAVVDLRTRGKWRE